MGACSGLWFLLLGGVFASGCGTRTELSSFESEGDPFGMGGGEGACTAAPFCADSTRGTYRLVAADGVLIGHLFLFDGSDACGGSETHYLLVLERFEDGRRCSRNADIEVITDTRDTFVARADRHGGSFGRLCGGEPSDEEVVIELLRMRCEDNLYEVTVRNSEPDSPYTLMATASRCRCDIGWEPCVEPLPDDPCGQ